MRFARKWRRKGLKRLIPRPEMEWPRRARTPKIWRLGRGGAILPPQQLRGPGRAAARRPNAKSTIDWVASV
jgi:hypothetical protein